MAAGETVSEQQSMAIEVYQGPEFFTADHYFRKAAEEHVALIGLTGTLRQAVLDSAAEITETGLANMFAAADDIWVRNPDGTTNKFTKRKPSE
jgi:hypothetical protein